MKIGFIGDTHGHWQGLSLAVKKLKDAGATMFIQVGDFGFWPHKPLAEWIEYDPYPYLAQNEIHWIDGNHEHFTLLKKTFDIDKLEPQPYPDADNILYVPRGTILELDGIKFGFLGGAWSIDHARRVEGVSMFKEELITENEAWRILGKEIDFMVTHDAPMDAYVAMGLPDPYPLFGVSRDECNHVCQRHLQAILEHNKPKWWVHGHYHMYYETIVKDCEVIGLHMTRTDGWGKTNVEGAYQIFDTEKQKFEDSPAHWTMR